MESFRALNREVVAQVVRVCQKHISKVIVGPHAFFRGGPHNPRGMESFLNERLQEDKDKLRALDPESSGLVILNSPDMFGAPHLRLHNMELYQTINLPPFLGVIPEEEAEWNDEWQAKFDLLMLIQHLQFEMGVYRQKQAHLLAFSEDLEELFKQLDMLMSAWTNPASVAEPEA